MRVLVISHGHPDFSVGGAEIAAYGMFQTLQASSEVASADFLARTDLPSVSRGSIAMRRPQEYLWRQDIADWFLLRTAYATGVYDDLRAFVRERQPDVIFVHHYAHMGLDFLRELRRELPHAFICITLHEYMAICHNNGQMIKAGSRKLCHGESPEECAMCFPEHSSDSFWLRKHFIQKHFEAADAFVSPSHFLRQRYIGWGIPREHIAVIENGHPTFDDKTDSGAGNLRHRFGFFGQINEFKGVDILLQAMHMMRPEIRRSMVVEIHGTNLEMQPKPFQEIIEKLRVPLIAEGSLRWRGPYEPRELQGKMKQVGWILVPSIWWENSPMVIQEAYASRRPVITSNIGGMAEKVRHDIDGLQFEVRSPIDLADSMTRALEAGLWERLVSNISQPVSHADSARAYLRLYQDHA